jgi:hypothetical protein
MNTTETSVRLRLHERVFAFWLLPKVRYVLVMLNRKRKRAKVVGRELK